MSWLESAAGECKDINIAAIMEKLNDFVGLRWSYVIHVTIIVWGNLEFPSKAQYIPYPFMPQYVNLSSAERFKQGLVTFSRYFLHGISCVFWNHMLMHCIHLYIEIIWNSICHPIVGLKTILMVRKWSYKWRRHRNNHLISIALICNTLILIYINCEVII